MVDNESAAVIPAASPACSHGAHHWFLGNPTGPTTEGICKWCGARRQFSNDFSYSRRGQTQAPRAPATKLAGSAIQHSVSEGRPPK